MIVSSSLFSTIVKTAFVTVTLASSVHGGGSDFSGYGKKVPTTSGRVRGHAAPDAPSVFEYLGIPYALPPVGDLRFKEPVKYVSDNVVDASNFGPACMQAKSSPIPSEVKDLLGMPNSSDLVLGIYGIPPGDPGPLSEDCLTLNVWTRRNKCKPKKPVLVWVHGGSFTSGSSNLPAYNGKIIANEEDVVVVSINYRLTVFGFPGNPRSSLNLGLLDLRMAMEWVRDNIEAFGGDKHRVTMFGESAGAGLIDYYSFAYHADPIADGFVLMSGVAEGAGAPINTTVAESNWLALAGRMGCPNETVSEQTDDCMRRQPADLIITAQSTGDYTLGATPGFVPVADGELVFDDYIGQPSAPGGYIVGHTDNEAGFFYPRLPTLPLETWNMLNDLVFNCPAALRANLSRTIGRPTWRYRYFGDFPNQVITTMPPSGAWHGSELPVIFGTSPTDAVPNTPEQIAIGKYIRGALVAFAKDTTKGLLSYGGKGRGWPLYDASENTLIRPGYENRVGTNLALGGMYDEVCFAL